LRRGVPASARSSLRWLALVMPILICATAAAAEDGPAGSWRGAVVESSLTGSPAEFQANIAISGGTVTARWTRLDGGEASIRLEPGDYGAVLIERKQGLSAMFGRDKPIDPLQSQPLLWGRLEGQGLVLYELAIARNGEPRLDRYHLAPAGVDELQLEASRVGPAGEPTGGLRALLRREAR
jgi:hypothetical protein